MCGIAGAFGPRAAELVPRLTRALAHRGPDDDGCATLAVGGEPAGALGHRRLAIIDVSPSGHQPMATASGRFTIVFNGEIYNYQALRDELRREGAEPQGPGDTAVLLAGWARHGARFLERLRGMFAFALWDAERGTGWLVRDPFGIKPLVVARSDDTLCFASELRALLDAGVVERRLSREAVASFLATGSVAEPLTIVAGATMLPAGTVSEVRVVDGRAELGAPVPYGPPLLSESGEPERDPAAAARMVRAALRDSVAHHLVADVPVGLFLSGGIDSSVVVALAAEVAREPLQTFTVVFEEQGFDESAPARAVARRFGTRHHAVPLSGRALLAALPEAFAAMDQPSLDGLNTFVVSRAVRERGLKVVLSGLGGDELFAGYPSFARARSLARLWGPTLPLRHAAAALGRRAGGLRGEKAALLLAGESPALAAYRASRALFGPRQVAALAGAAALPPLPHPPAGLSPLQQVSWYELTGYMRNTLLRDSDVFSMAHALELRVPFVDPRVAECSARIDDALKLRPGTSKPLLVDAVADLLPREVWDRPKQGFTLPFAPWLRGPLAATVDRELSPLALADVGLSPVAARRLWDGFRRGGAPSSWSRVWALYTLVRWAREHRVELGDDLPSLAAPATPALLVG